MTGRKNDLEWYAVMLTDPEKTHNDQHAKDKYRTAFSDPAGHAHVAIKKRMFVGRYTNVSARLHVRQIGFSKPPGRE
jgi:hypothetical protein